MPANRPAIPSALDRRVRVEAGHRCAIPVCRVPVIEIAHIRPWAQVRRHEFEFENLIALCPTCHTLFDRGHIDRVSMLKYKANLSPFSPYALAAHPDHIDLLAAYQKFRVFIETWLTAALAFQEAEQRGSSPVNSGGVFKRSTTLPRRPVTHGSRRHPRRHRPYAHTACRTAMARYAYGRRCWKVRMGWVN
ncbi:hypothetical protein Srufu_070130 [Streptomyces libani subsp. rufus]|nr:hypothetical protein Srufu_070130 [Streptomyces libani subsp. rufus]